MTVVRDNWGIIYRATNKKTGMVYIGQTIKSLKIRINGHKTNAFKKHSRTYYNKFPTAIRKYGIDGFTWDIIWEGERELLNDKEIEFIEKYDSFNNGYNLTKGGSGLNGHEGLKGEKNPMYGKKLTQEQKDNISIKASGSNNGRAIKIIHQFYHEVYGTYEGYRSDFRKIYNLHKKPLNNLIEGVTTQYNGWVLLKNKDRYNEMLGKFKFYHHIYGIEELTQNEMVLKYKLRRTGINNLVKGRIKSTNGWILYNNQKPPNVSDR